MTTRVLSRRLPLPYPVRGSPHYDIETEVLLTRAEYVDMMTALEEELLREFQEEEQQQVAECLDHEDLANGNIACRNKSTAASFVVGKHQRTEAVRRMVGPDGESVGGKWRVGSYVEGSI